MATCARISSRGRATGPDVGTATRTRTAARAGTARPHRGIRVRGGRAERGEGVRRVRGGFGVAEKQLFFNDAPRGAGAWAQKPTPGDWLCGRCDSLNFKKRDDCNRCRASRSHRAMAHPRERRRVRSKTRETGGEAEKTRGETRQKRWGERPGASTIPGRGRPKSARGRGRGAGPGPGSGSGRGQKTTSANAFPVVILLLLLLH